MKRARAALLVVALLSFGAGGAWWVLSGSQPSSGGGAPVCIKEAEPKATTAPQSTPALPARTGQILGIGIGSSIEEAREKWDRLREGDEHAPEGEKEEGERVYWKLKETEYSWIIAWAGEQGKITRMRAMLRPDKLKPFSEIGDLADASVNQPNIAAWNLTAADGSPMRFIAQGPERRATTIYIFSLRTPTPQD